jgi:alkaline phosphatase
VQVASTTQQGRGGDVNAAPFVVPLTTDVPTLKDLTLAAINVLDDDPDGFVLMVEGGAIDWANHSNLAGRMVEETISFNDAITAACAWVEANGGWDNTLVIVTADHESGGLAGPDSKRGLEPVVNQGKGQLPKLEWETSGHTNSLVPVFAKGAGAELLKLVADQQDPIRGAYLDDTELPLVMLRAMQSY